MHQPPPPPRGWRASAVCCHQTCRRRACRAGPSPRRHAATRAGRRGTPPDGLPYRGGQWTIIYDRPAHAPHGAAACHTAVVREMTARQGGADHKLVPRGTPPIGRTPCRSGRWRISDTAPSLSGRFIARWSSACAGARHANGMPHRCRHSRMRQDRTAPAPCRPPDFCPSYSEVRRGDSAWRCVASSLLPIFERHLSLSMRAPVYSGSIRSAVS